MVEWDGVWAVWGADVLCWSPVDGCAQVGDRPGVSDTAATGRGERRAFLLVRAAAGLGGGRAGGGMGVGLGGRACSLPLFCERMLVRSFVLCVSGDVTIRVATHSAQFLEDH